MIEFGHPYLGFACLIKGRGAPYLEEHSWWGEDTVTMMYYLHLFSFQVGSSFPFLPACQKYYPDCFG